MQLSVDADCSEEELYAIGQSLASLREEGFLIFASGNIVHNLGRVEWDNEDGTPMAHAFNNYIIDAVEKREDDKVIHYQNGPEAAYAVPTPEHYLPLIYTLGATKGETPIVFNKVCNLGSMAMTGFVFGL